MNGSFTEDADWRFDSPGVQLEAGLAGDRVGGPLILLVRAEPGRTGFPRLRLPTEMLHIVVGGSLDDGSGSLHRAEIRLSTGDVEAPALVAGSDGAWLAKSDRQPTGPGRG